jgi:hypothetical protein
VEHGLIIPHDQVMRRPSMGVDETRLCRERHQAIDERPSLRFPHPLDSGGVGTEVERRAVRSLHDRRLTHRGPIRSLGVAHEIRIDAGP